MPEVVNRIILRLEKEGAAASSKEFFAGERQRQKKWLSDAEIAEKALTKAMQREQKQRIDDLSKSIGTAKELRIAAAKAEAETMKAAAKESQRLARERAAADKQAAKEARDLGREQAKADRETAKASLDAKRAAAAEEKRIATEANRLFTFIQRDNARVAKQAAAEQSAADKQAFRDWKQTQDMRHNLAMKSWDEQQKAQEDNKNSLGEIGSALAGLGIGFSGLSVAKKGFEDITEGALEAAERLKMMADEFIKLRDAGRELAGVMGQKPTTKVTQDQLDFAAETGQTGDEARDFRLSFRGEAQQFKDRFKPGEFEKFEKAAAKLQVKEGLESGVTGKIAAGAIRTLPKGQKDLTADQVLTPLAEGFQTLQGGSGSNPVLANQYAQVISGGIGPEGQFRDHKEAAVAVRTQAQYNDADAGMHTRSIQRGINQLDDSQSAALGLNDKQNFFEQMEAIRQAYKKSGVPKLSKFLGKAGFSDERTRVGIETHINEGIEGGVVDAGFKDANKFKLDQYKADTNEFYTAEDQPGALRVSRAKTAAKEGRLSQNKVKLAKTMEDAKRANLAFDTNDKGAAINKLANRWAPEAWVPASGYKDAEEIQQYARATSMVEGRAKAAGVDVGPSMNDRNMMGVRGIVSEGKGKTEEYLAKLITLAESAEKQREEAKRQREEQIKKAEPPPQPLGWNGGPRVERPRP